MKPFVFLLSILVLSSTSYANTQTKDQLSEEYMKIINLKGAVKVLLSQFKQATSSTIDQVFHKMDSNMSEEQLLRAKKQLRERENLKEKFIEDTLTWKNLKHEYMKIYSDTYTKDELLALIKFNKSPVGQSILKKQKIIQMKSMKMSQELMMETLPKFMKEFKKISKKQIDASYKRACLANQRTILGALEMYSLDNNITLQISKDSDLKKLVDSGYLLNVPRHPGDEETEVYNTDKCGNIWCTVHGNHKNECDPCNNSECKKFTK